MSKFGVFLKTAGGVVATTITLLTALRENPQIAKGLDDAVDKVKAATNSDNPKLRFDAKLSAINVAADAVDETFPGTAEADGWRRQAQALRVRGELAWGANTGKSRRKAMKALNVETAELLEQINLRLADMQAKPEIAND